MLIHTDSEKLAEILLQRPIDLRGPRLGSNRLTETEIAYFQQEAKKHFDVVLDTLKKMPRDMLLIIRCVTFIFGREIVNKFFILIDQEFEHDPFNCPSSWRSHRSAHAYGKVCSTVSNFKR